MGIRRSSMSRLAIPFETQHAIYGEETKATLKSDALRLRRNSFTAGLSFKFQTIEHSSRDSPSADALIGGRQSDTLAPHVENEHSAIARSLRLDVQFREALGSAMVSEDTGRLQ